MSESVMRGYIEKACDEIDAAVFSGDAFVGEEGKEHRKALREYMARWERQLQSEEAEIEL